MYQAILDDEPHVPHIASLTTLAGYVHRRLTGRHVLGIGDASGTFPIDSVTGNFDAHMLEQFDAVVTDRHPGTRLVGLLPAVLRAGEQGRHAHPRGRRSVALRQANVSVGTSVFALVVLDKALERVHEELDPVTTPAGDLVAMVHCNNGVSELGAWAQVFGECLGYGRVSWLRRRVRGPAATSDEW
jgi:sugar (pentulose or hexulose) kinase